MQRRVLAGMMIAALIVACSKDSSSPTLGQTGANGSAAPATGTDTGTTGTPGTPTTPPATEPTSNNPVVTVTLSPTSLSIPAGYYGRIDAAGRDAAGVRVANKIATWTSDDPSIVAAGDTGVFLGKAVGTTIVRATIDGHTASASVTVTPSVIAPPPTSTPGVSQFDLTATVVGALAGTDTSQTQPVSGATVHLTRTGGVSGDTLATAIDAGSGVTDAQGVISFKGLAGGWYTVDVTPPSGSPYTSMHAGFGAPHVTDFRVHFNLSRK